MSKPMVIESIPGTTLVRIKFEGGGETPDELKGAWTNGTVAKHAIAAWLADQKDRTVDVKDQRIEDEKKAQERVRK